MRNTIFNVSVALVSLAAGLLTGDVVTDALSAPTAVHATAVCGPEDSRAYNAAKCGNRTIGVQVDWTPNNGPKGTFWYSLKFDKSGTKGTFTRQTWR